MWRLRPFVLSLSKHDQRSSKPTPSGVARQQATFFCFAKRNQPKKRLPRYATPAGFPALLDWSGLLITSHDPLRGHVLKHIRRTTPDQPALLGGAQGKEMRNPKKTNRRVGTLCPLYCVTFPLRQVCC